MLYYSPIEGSSELLGNPGDQVVEVTEILDVLPTSLTPSSAEVKLESVQTVGTTAMIGKVKSFL